MAFEKFDIRVYVQLMIDREDFLNYISLETHSRIEYIIKVNAKIIYTNLYTPVT